MCSLQPNSDGPLGDLLGDALDGLFDGGTEDTPGILPSPFPQPLERGPRPTIYVSTVAEPDRNFVGEQEFEEGEGQGHSPILSEHLLQRMAELHLEGRTITLGSLYRLLTDVEIGLGARLTYVMPTPGHRGPPPTVFETEDGIGVERNVEPLMFALSQGGLADAGADADDIRALEDPLREAMAELLDGTAPPTFERLFGAIARERIESVEHLIEFVRAARAHLPFSRTGPGTFYVVADNNPYGPEGEQEVNPVTVDAELDDRGRPQHVQYAPSGDGSYYLGFTHGTDEEHAVELIIKETGRMLHSHHGAPIRLDMDDADMFESIDGRPFIDFVSDTGTFYPGVPVTVRNPGFHTMHEPPREPQVQIAEESPTGEEMPDQGPTMQLFVLATEPGPDAEPVAVDFDVTSGAFTYNAGGRYYLSFLPESEAEGVFGLYDTDLNIAPTMNDLRSDRFIDTFVPFEDDVRPEDDSFPRPEDHQERPDGEFPPPDEVPNHGPPPTPDGENPPDGNAPPPSNEDNGGTTEDSQPGGGSGEPVSPAEVGSDGGTSNTTDDTPTAPVDEPAPAPDAPVVNDQTDPSDNVDTLPDGDTPADEPIAEDHANPFDVVDRPPHVGPTPEEPPSAARRNSSRPFARSSGDKYMPPHLPSTPLY